MLVTFGPNLPLFHLVHLFYFSPLFPVFRFILPNTCSYIHSLSRHSAGLILRSPIGKPRTVGKYSYNDGRHYLVQRPSTIDKRSSTNYSITVLTCIFEYQRIKGARDTTISYSDDSEVDHNFRFWLELLHCLGYDKTSRAK